MKTYSNFRWGAARPSRRRQILCAGLVCATTLLVAGCGQKSDTSAPNSAAPMSAENSQSASAASATNTMPDLRPLNRALMQWVMQNHRAAANFEEFAASANIKIPPPPPGKKYVINSHGLINLVNAN